MGMLVRLVQHPGSPVEGSIELSRRPMNTSEILLYI